MTTILHQHSKAPNISNNFSNIPNNQRHKVKTLTGQSVKNNLDFAKFLTASHSKINDYQNKENVNNQSNGVLDSQLSNWHDRVSRANEEHRRNLRNLGNDLTKIVGANSQLTNDLQNLANRNLSDTNFKIGYVNPQEAKSEMDQVLKILDPKSMVNQKPFVN
jgi:hypothetical protein